MQVFPSCDFVSFVAEVDTLSHYRIIRCRLILTRSCRIMIGFTIQMNRICGQAEKGAPCAPRS